MLRNYSLVWEWNEGFLFSQGDLAVARTGEGARAHMVLFGALGASGSSLC